MKQKEKTNIKKSTVNFVGSIGYLFCFLQLFWVVMLYFSVIQSIPLAPPETDKQIEQFPGFTLTLPDPIEATIVGIVVVVMIVLTLYILVKIPMSIAKTSNAVVHSAAEAMTPVVIKAQHKKDIKKFRVKITTRLILAIKVLLVIVPIVLTAASGLLEQQSIDYSIAMIIGGGLACLSAAIFIVQYMMASILRVKPLDLW